MKKNIVRLKVKTIRKKKSHLAIQKTISQNLLKLNILEVVKIF